MPDVVALQQSKQGILLPVRVKPRGKANKIEGVRAGVLLVSVTAAPTDGQANAAVIETDDSIAAGHILRFKRSLLFWSSL